MATTVAVSRAYVRIHHGSDVVAGLATGAVLGLAARRLLQRARPRLTPRRPTWQAGQMPTTNQPSRVAVADRQMSDAEALMWRVEKDPFLASTFGAVTILDRPT